METSKFAWVLGNFGAKYALSISIFSSSTATFFLGSLCCFLPSSAAAASLFSFFFPLFSAIFFFSLLSLGMDEQTFGVLWVVG